MPGRAEHRDWIGGRAVTLLSHYWRDDDPVELTAAIGQDWADVLEGLPREAIQSACIAYQRVEPRRKPTPGAIYQLAKESLPKPTAVPMRKTTREEDAAYMARVGKIDPVRKAQAEKILAEVAAQKRASQ